jgi:hypothetical protein
MRIGNRRTASTGVALGTVVLLALATADDNVRTGGEPEPEMESALTSHVSRELRKGRRTFRFDTFGDEAFWGGALRLHDGIQGAAFGGVGPGVSPRAALALGLKVDVNALPGSLRRQIEQGQADLDSPATTLALLRLNAVVGVKGFFRSSPPGLRAIGIQCALCHSTVDDSLLPGIGRRLDGWANRDLDIGKVVNVAPNLQPVADLLGVSEAAVRDVITHWGVGKFDAELFLDRKTAGPNGSAATLIPPAFGLSGVNLHTWTGWGSVTYWNAFVANLEMHGQGTFYDPRLDDALQFPVAAANGFGNVRSDVDRITPKLAALHLYQLALPIPRAPHGSFDREAARRGRDIFSGKAGCASCHVPPLYTEPGWNLHTPAEVGIDSFQADRAPDHRYRTAPLRGLWTHTKGGFYHDGRFPTLEAVIDHYASFQGFVLSPGEKRDLVQFLLSL